jgi:NDP-sugar pyrophosphorylase family protein
MINAGIYVLEPESLARIPADTVFSIERGYFPSLVKDKETFVAYQYRGYWIDIGTPEKYRQAHRDIMDGHFLAPPFATMPGKALISPDAKIEAGAIIEGPCFIDAGTVVKAGAKIGPYTVIGAHCHIAEGAHLDGTILWPNTWVDAEARLTGAVAGRHCHFGRNVDIGDGAMFGDKSVVTDFSRTHL